MKSLIFLLSLMLSSSAYSLGKECLNTSHEFNYDQIGSMVRDNKLDEALDTVEKEIRTLTSQGCDNESIKFFYAKAAIIAHTDDLLGAQQEIDKAIQKVELLIDDRFYFLYFFDFMRFKSHILNRLSDFKSERFNRDKLHNRIFVRYSNPKFGKAYRNMLAQSHFDFVSMYIGLQNCSAAKKNLSSAQSLLAMSSSAALLVELDFLRYMTDIECNRDKVSKEKVLSLYQRWKESGQYHSYNFDHFYVLFEKIRGG